MVSARASWCWLSAFVLLLAPLGSTTAIKQRRDHDCCTKLTKPPLVSSLDYLEPGLDAMPMASYTKVKWWFGWIPQEVKKIAQDLKLDPADFDTYDIHYNDCSDPWVFGYHRQSNITIDSMASQFGKVPLQMRQFVRHVITVPGQNGWAFAWNGDITFVRPVDHMLTAIIHETGHCLDGNGAYGDKGMSISDNWWNNYEQDSNVPDPYAQTNNVENVAQNTVVSVYNENVATKYAGIEPKWQNIFHQYATLITAAQQHGQPGYNLFQQSGHAINITHRLPPSQAVPISGSSKRSAAPRKWLNKGNFTLIDTSGQKAKPKSNCGLSW